MIKFEFSALLQSSVSHDPSEIIRIWWFAAKETFLLVSVLWKQLCCSIFLCKLWYFQKCLNRKIKRTAFFLNGFPLWHCKCMLQLLLTCLMCLWWIQVLYSLLKYMKQHGRTLHHFLSHSAVDQPLIHWHQWASLTISICGFWMGTVDTLLILFPEGCALLILHSDIVTASTLTHLLFFGVSHPTSAVNATPSMCFITYIFSLLYLNPPTFPPPTHSWTGSDETPVPSHVAIYLLSFNSFSCSKDQLMLVKTGLCRLFLLWCWYCISGQCWCFCWLKYPPSEIQWLLCMISYNNVCAVLEKNTNEAVDSNSCFPPYFFQLLP